MKAHVINIWMEEKDYLLCNTLRIDFSNNYHIRIVIDGFTPESLERAFLKAAKYINKAERNGLLEVQP